MTYIITYSYKKINFYFSKEVLIIFFPKYNIISFDGGGVRGAFTVHILKQLLNNSPQLLRKTNLLAGTSTGALIALALAYDININKLIEFYSYNNCKFIFTPKNLNLAKPRYDNCHLKEVLTSLFPKNLKLKDLKYDIIIPSFQIVNKRKKSWQPIFFNNLPCSNTANTSVIDVALASTAAPTYFPAYKKYIDGGVIANNPSLAALSLAIDRGQRRIKQLRLLSLGTGFNQYQIKSNAKAWGVLQWTINPNPPPVVPLLSILTDGATKADSKFCSQLLGNKFFRINPKLDKMISLDNYKEVPYLISIAKEYNLCQAECWINKCW